MMRGRTQIIPGETRQPVEGRHVECPYPNSFTALHAYGYGNPGVIGRQRFGRVTIANSDAVGSALFQTAAEQAWRAVKELGS